MKLNIIQLTFSLFIFLLLGILIGYKLQSKPPQIIPDQPPTELKSCNYNGKVYQHGDSFKDIDDCNSCSCQNGAVACTMMACLDN